MTLILVFLGRTSGQTREQKEPSGSSNKKKNTEKVNASKTANQSISKNYRFIVSFISKGEGIDSKAINSLRSYVGDFEKRNNLTLKIEIISRGREGEKDFCFRLVELTPDRQKKFISEVKTLLKESDLTILTENLEGKNGVR